MLDLLLGHLVGDYLLQNDWMALNKANRHPGPKPPRERTKPADESSFMTVVCEASWILQNLKEWETWHERNAIHRRGHLTCTIHCALWTLSVCLFAGWLNPLIVAWLFLTHFAMDRYALAPKWMRLVGQTKFLTGPCAPWSGIVVDNIWHLLTIWVAYQATLYHWV